MNVNKEYINWVNQPKPPSFTMSPEEAQKFKCIAFAEYCLNKVEGRHLWLITKQKAVGQSKIAVFAAFIDQPKLSDIMADIRFADMTPNQVKNILDNGQAEISSFIYGLTKVEL